ncbi:MAG: hypothetical protein WKF41_15990 [Gaiellaceae bacterium]
MVGVYSPPAVDVPRRRHPPAGITGFLRAGALRAWMPPPAHTASVALHPAPSGRLDLEYFHDHARIERLLDGPSSRSGAPWRGPRPARQRPRLKRADAARYAA